MELDVHVESLGSTTFRRGDLDRGFEPDSYFYIRNAASVRGKKRIDLSTDPPPDLVIEIDITSPSLDKFPSSPGWACPRSGASTAAGSSSTSWPAANTWSGKRASPSRPSPRPTSRPSSKTAKEWTDPSGCGNCAAGHAA